MQKRLLAIAGVGAFVLLLLVMTLRSTPTPLDQSLEERNAAQQVCRASVLLQVSDGRFPFDATIEDHGGDRLRLSGSLDSGSGAEATRQNYECLLRRGPSGTYLADSVIVWRSH